MAEIIFDIKTIVAGNNGNKLPISLKNAGSIEGATVRIAIKRGAEVFTKQAEIIDATAGKCEVTLSATDLPLSGLYFYQPTITYADGREFTGDVGRFTVGGKLSGQPPVTIPVGIDLNRLGISANNRLTIDGIEQIVGTGGGGSVPSNVILFEDWVGGESVTIDTGTTPADTTAPLLTISPAGGNFASTQGVTMTTNETANIYYTLDGSTPTTASTKYTAALSLSATTTLNAFAVDTAGNSSAVQTVTFTKDVSAPADTTAPIVTASPVAGTYTAAQTVTLSANETATIYYTTNGTTPTTASSVYSAPINITATTTLQYMAKDTAGNQSVPVAATYTINIPQADTTAPVLTVTAAATFAESQTVNMSVNETADIWYTVDGSDPKTSGTRVKYSAPVTLTATTTVKAYAVDTAGNASGVQTVTYTLAQTFSRLQMDGIDDKITTPSITFDKVEIDGLFDSSQDVLRYILQNVTGGTTVLVRIDNTDKLVMGTGMTQSGFILDSRTVLTLTLASAVTTSLQIFARGDGAGSFAKGEIYSIKFYNGANQTAAHYNMATGTVQDQSGNEKHATLTGGTWN